MIEWVKIDNESSELSHLSDSTRDSTRDPCPVTGSIRLKWELISRDVSPWHIFLIYKHHISLQALIFIFPACTCSYPRQLLSSDYHHNVWFKVPKQGQPWSTNQRWMAPTKGLSLVGTWNKKRAPWRSEPCLFSEVFLIYGIRWAINWSRIGLVIYPKHARRRE